VQLVTGVLAAPLVEKFAALAEQALDVRAAVLPVRNNWFGHTVTVAGLLTGRDVKDALLAAGRADVALIPDVMLRDDSDVFLDDVTVEQLSRETGRPVLPVSVWPGDALRSLARWLSA
jgi:NifB/MoaA-like Fe-S oxidoreductase